MYRVSTNNLHYTIFYCDAVRQGTVSEHLDIQSSKFLNRYCLMSKCLDVLSYLVTSQSEVLMAEITFVCSVQDSFSYVVMSLVTVLSRFCVGFNLDISLCIYCTGWESGVYIQWY